MGAFRVVLGVAEIERRERRHRPGDADRASVASSREQRREHSAAAAAELGPRRWIRDEEALGEAHAADVEAASTSLARRSTASTSSVEPPPMSTTSVSSSDGRPAETPRTISAASSAPSSSLRGEPVAPLDLAEERLAVLGVADRARRDRERPGRAELLELAAIVGEAVPNARDRDREKARRSSTPSPSRVIVSRRDDLARARRRRRPRRGAGSSSSRGRPLRRGSS